MNRIVQFVAILLVITSVASCKKDKDEEETAGFFRFTANGQAYDFNKAVSCYVNSISNGNLLVLRGELNSDNVASGSLPAFNGPGAYAMDSTRSNQIVLKISGNDYFIGALNQPKAHGQITVLQSRTEGSYTYYTATFSGVAYRSATDSLVITNGSIEDDSF